MPLTKRFKELVQRRVRHDPEFAAALKDQRDRQQVLSPMLDSIQETAAGLHAASVMDEPTMKKLDAACGKLGRQGADEPWA